ncbi:acylneuraminate cytidylyltransferase family protein [Flavobacterium sp.]|uniref:acylneuraminate cytidylyltransferase family protein n=1 Tax=Flavobacterium sp. TaxID=239 RepID=UPI002B4B034F|nr:acylneuraminate cytidylyltransferase family protein [Flavobacterium sp.]HLF51233.1 acylneuraminate cytidylyltransferase family protein [Flavobacterium sp.]
MRILVVIPARGGSKGVPGKNIRVLGDRPLIAHAIACAKSAKNIKRLIVSTDSEETATIARQFGAEVIIRPSSLAEDTSNVITAVNHVYEALQETFDVIVLLQPTAPLRTGKDLDNVITMLAEDMTIDGVISVVPMDDMHPARMYNLSEEGVMVPFLADGETLRRQDLKPVYYRNGCFYAVRTKAFFEEQSFMVSNKRAYIMNPEWLVNIDSKRDFKLATLLYEEWKDEITNNGI